MSIQLTKEEKKIYIQTINEEHKKDPNVAILRIVWELHKKGLKRHTFAEMRRLVTPRVKQYRNLQAATAALRLS